MADERPWSVHVYDGEGNWYGFFRDRNDAKAWVGKREGFEITTRRPSRKETEDGKQQQHEAGVHAGGHGQGEGGVADTAGPPGPDT